MHDSFLFSQHRPAVIGRLKPLFSFRPHHGRNLLCRKMLPFSALQNRINFLLSSGTFRNHKPFDSNTILSERLRYFPAIPFRQITAFHDIPLLIFNNCTDLLKLQPDYTSAFQKAVFPFFCTHIIRKTVMHHHSLIIKTICQGMKLVCHTFPAPFHPHFVKIAFRIPQKQMNSIYFLISDLSGSQSGGTFSCRIFFSCYSSFFSVFSVPFTGTLPDSFR